MTTFGRWVFSAGFLTAMAVAKPAMAEGTETDCANKIDDDGDGLPDCGDADCSAKPECTPDGQPENTNARCSDFIDNDSNGHFDCDDDECNSGLVTACKGTWVDPGDPSVAGDPIDNTDDLPDLAPGQSVEDLIGKGSDKDGERNEYVCADGIDNDGDGRVDCADFGCRFDPDVKVCQGNPGMRFSIIANVGGEYDFEKEQANVAFSKIQLRTFGPMPLIQDSFYYLSMRVEKTPRLTFAMFQVPLAKGHFMNVNSGGGGLSNAAVLSTSKHVLIDAPFYLTAAFDQGNSAAVEAFGPIDPGGIVDYRVYAAGGSGISTGSVGGVYYGFDNRNFTWGVGASFQFDILGNYSRWDSEFLYTPAPLTLAVVVGGKYDVRAQERFVAENLKVIFRWKYIHLSAETFVKQEFEFDSMSFSYNVTADFLLVEKYLELAADFGEFVAGDMGKPPEVAETELKRQLDELQWRVALHAYFFRNIGLATILYTDREVAPSDSRQTEPSRERRLEALIQYRF